MSEKITTNNDSQNSTIGRLIGSIKELFGFTNNQYPEYIKDNFDIDAFLPHHKSSDLHLLSFEQLSDLINQQNINYHKVLSLLDEILNSKYYTLELDGVTKIDFESRDICFELLNMRYYLGDPTYHASIEYIRELYNRMNNLYHNDSLANIISSLYNTTLSYIDHDQYSSNKADKIISALRQLSLFRQWLQKYQNKKLTNNG